VFLSGRVTLEDGTAPPQRVVIERVCHGQVRREGYTDSQGSFGFQLGAEATVLQDASVGAFDTMRAPGGGTTGAAGGVAMLAPSLQSATVSAKDLTGCELRASLAGFRSEPINLAGRWTFEDPDVGVIVLHRLGKVEGTRISVTTLQAPPEARKAWERAHHAMLKHHPAEAVQQLQKAVTVYPRFAEALSQLGELYSEQGRKDEAARLLQQAIEADPRFVPPYLNLASLAGEQRDWPRMAELSQKALALNPYEYPLAFFYDAIANYNLRNFDAAEKSARTARRLDSQNHMSRIEFLLANILLQRDDYAGAAEQLRSFLKYSPSGAESDSARELLAQIESKLAARK
jgi:Flp pilus assembly protein TadD